MEFSELVERLQTLFTSLTASLTATVAALDNAASKINALNITSPDLKKAPDQKTPELKLPELKLPELKLPNLKLPDTDVLGGLTKGLSQAGSALTGGISKIAGSLGPYGAAIAAGLGALTAGFDLAKDALKAYVGAIVSIPDMVKPFVQAFNPQAVELFDQQLRNVYATIGQAFLPVFRVFTAALSSVGDIIGPSFEKLRGPVESLSRAFVTTFLPVVRLLTDGIDRAVKFFSYFTENLQVAAGNFAAFVEIFRSVADVFGAFHELLFTLFKPLIDFVLGIAQVNAALIEFTAAYFKVLAAWWGGLMDILGAFLSDGQQMGSLFDTLTSAIKEATQAFVLLAARTFKLYGFDSALKRLQESLDPTKGGTKKVAAPSDFSVTGIEDVLRESTLLAAQANGGAGPKSTEDLLAGLHDQVSDIAKNGATLNLSMNDLKKAVEDEVEKVVSEVKELPAQIAAALTNLPSQLRPSFQRVSPALNLLNRLGV